MAVCEKADDPSSNHLKYVPREGLDCSRLMKASQPAANEEHDLAQEVSSLKVSQEQYSEGDSATRAKELADTALELNMRGTSGTAAVASDDADQSPRPLEDFVIPKFVAFLTAMRNVAVTLEPKSESSPFANTLVLPDVCHQFVAAAFDYAHKTHLLLMAGQLAHADPDEELELGRLADLAVAAALSSRQEDSAAAAVTAAVAAADAGADAVTDAGNAAALAPAAVAGSATPGVAVVAASLDAAAAKNEQNEALAAAERLRRKVRLAARAALEYAEERTRATRDLAARVHQVLDSIASSLQ